MKRYSYRAYDASGTELQGKIEAADFADAKSQLANQKIMLVSMEEDIAISQGVELFARRTVTSQEVEYLTSELSLLLNSGITVDRALAILRRNSSSEAQARLIADLHDGVRRGENLADVMAGQSTIFNPLYLNLVRLGELSGTLPDIFSKLADDMKFQSELRRKIVQALTYPAVIFAVCLLCILFVFNYIVPQMQGLFEGIPELPRYTKILLGASQWVINYQWFVFFAFLAIGFAVLLGRKNPAISSKIDNFLVSLPLASGAVILVERIRFNTAIALMLESGILIDKCLEMAVGSVKSQALAQGLVSAKDQVKKGATLTSALRNSPIYNDFAISLIEVGEESGELSKVFGEISIRSRREFESAVDRATSLLEPALILVMGLIVGGVVVTMLLSIVSVNEVGF